MFTHLAKHRDAVHDWHIVVQHDEVGLMGYDCFQTLHAIGSFEKFAMKRTEYALKHQSYRATVIDTQYFWKGQG
jgi:hypothetical protein